MGAVQFAEWWWTVVEPYHSNHTTVPLCQREDGLIWEHSHTVEPILVIR